ncbi:MAG TPA: ABC transporter ATP-binding protein [Sedimentibacter sp.]|nr:ABC transporter ATP-binding protein [Sedimentibacter sp.]
MNFIYKTTKGYRGYFLVLFLAVVLSTISGSMFPYITGKIVDQIFYKKQIRGFLLCFFIYAALYLINQIFHGVLNYVWAQLKATYVVNIRKICFSHVIKLKAAVLTNIKSGDVMNRILEDTECFLEFIHRSLFYLLSNFVQLFIAIGYLLITNIYLGLIAILLTPIIALYIRFFSRKIKKQYFQIQEQKGFLNSWIMEMMVGISQWKLLNAHKKVMNDYTNKLNKIRKNEIKVGYQEIASVNLNEALTTIGLLGIYCISTFYILNNKMTVGQFIACAAYFSTCATYFNAIGTKITDINANLIGIKRIEDLLKCEEEQDSVNAIDREIITGEINFSNISFSYESENRNILEKFNLKIVSGDRIAIVGKSGEGKSTLIQLLCRLYEPCEGKICIDDICLQEYTISSLRKQIAVVQQENGLFYSSLRMNIALTNDCKNDDTIKNILSGLKLDGLLEELPDGLDTVVGEGARELSGGQKQRIAIARCLYRKPLILLLDEATSALDEETEREVNKFIYSSLPNATILTVSHRFSTVITGNKIVVLANQKVAGMGNHEYLMKECAQYKSLYFNYFNMKSVCNDEV